MNNGQRARAFFQQVLNDGRLDLLDDHVAGDYRTHVPELRNMPSLDDGIDALRTRLQTLGTIPNTVKRVLHDGDLVLVHVRYHGQPDMAGADFLRFDGEGRIAEHWFSRQIVPASVTDDSMFDGGGNPDAEVTPEKLAWNRQRLRDTYEILFGQGRHELVRQYYAPVYRQHNPHMPDGSERLETMLKTKGPVVPTVRRIVAAGDLVAGHSGFQMQGLDNDMNAGDRTNAVDIFRIDENNQYAEHWDVLQAEGNDLPHFTTFF